MIPISSPLRRGLGLLLLLGVAACAPPTYLVKEPTPSHLPYETSSPVPLRLSIIDERRGEELVFQSGRLPAKLLVDQAPIDAPAFLAKHLSAELASRGLPASAVTGDQGPPRIHLRTFRMRNYRASGFSPFVTFTSISADLDTPSGPRRIGVFVKRGKVPVWSFDEIVEPTLNQPLSIATKEFASKVATALYGYRSSDAAVRDLIAKVSAAPKGEAYLVVYALGFTNNPLAIDTLVSLVHDDDEYVRMAAISSLGNIGAVGQFALLKGIYETADSWTDRGMAAKAIGDLATPEAKAFIADELRRVSTAAHAKVKDTTWTLGVLALYQ